MYSGLRYLSLSVQSLERWCIVLAIRKLRKTIALVTAMTLAASAVPSISHSTETGTETGTEAGTETGTENNEEGTGESGETSEGSESGEEGGGSGQEGEGNTVQEDGEVVQKGALGKIDKKDWITIDDYEFITENDTYKMYFYKPRLSIMLENKETGKFIESTLSDEKDDGNSNATWNYYMKSGIVITAIIGTNSTYQVDLFNTPNTIPFVLEAQIIYIIPASFTTSLLGLYSILSP